MRRLAPIVALVYVLSGGALAENAPAQIEQCDTLQKLRQGASDQTPKYLCITYTQSQIAHAKIYSGGQFSKAEDGEYQFIGAPSKRIIKGVAHELDDEVEVTSPSKGWLQFFRGVYARPMAFFCSDGAVPRCAKAPDGTYTTTHQLAISIKDGIIQLQDPDPMQERNFCVYGRYRVGEQKSQHSFYRDSPDKAEYIVCMEGD